MGETDSTDDATAAGAEAAPDPEAAPDAGADPKDRFREALERKRHQQHLHESASAGDSKIHDSRGAAGGRRTFRRKSG